MNYSRRIGRRIIGGLVFFGILSFLLSLPVVLTAADAAPGSILDQTYTQRIETEQKRGPVSTGDLLIRLFGTLFLVGITGWVVVKFWKKKQQTAGQGNWMAVLDQVSLAPNKNLVVTDIAGKIFVIGVTDHSVQPIMEITDAQVIEALRQVQKEERQAPTAWGIDLLSGLLGKSNRQSDPVPSFHAEMTKQIQRLHALRERRREPDREGEDKL
ncbi:FliO/MopB family protein [Heliomicrobium modesticaldum]|nr:flagellar biosynthetic protein FliO [Heliomicrobium modesticaldum]